MQTYNEIILNQALAYVKHLNENDPRAQGLKKAVITSSNASDHLIEFVVVH